MTDNLSRFRYPTDGLQDKAGRVSRAGHHYLAGIEELAKAVAPALGAGAGIGDLATLDQITRAQLAPGFGVVAVQRSEIAATTAQSAVTGIIPLDNSIPQNTEGTQVLAGDFTPVSAASELEIKVEIFVGAGSSQDICAALFMATQVDAVAASWIDLRAATGTSGEAFARINYTHHMPSPGTSPITFAVRTGGIAATTYVNGISSGRIGGGVIRSFIHVTEWLTI